MTEQEGGRGIVSCQSLQKKVLLRPNMLGEEERSGMDERCQFPNDDFTHLSSKYVCTMPGMEAGG